MTFAVIFTLSVSVAEERSPHVIIQLIGNTPKLGIPATHPVRTILTLEARRQRLEPHHTSTFALPERGDITILGDAHRR
jgi:hypothetical protein